jgi:hypothetical protein
MNAGGEQDHAADAGAGRGLDQQERRSRVHRERVIELGRRQRADPTG